MCDAFQRNRHLGLCVRIATGEYHLLYNSLHAASCQLQCACGSASRSCCAETAVMLCCALCSKPLNRRYLVVEGIYANTGDVAPLLQIAALKHKCACLFHPINSTLHNEETFGPIQLGVSYHDTLLILEFTGSQGLSRNRYQFAE